MNPSTTPQPCGNTLDCAPQSLLDLHHPQFDGPRSPMITLVSGVIAVCLAGVGSGQSFLRGKVEPCEITGASVCMCGGRTPTRPKPEQEQRTSDRLQARREDEEGEQEV
jgi:hypothetical protein